MVTGELTGEDPTEQMFVRDIFGSNAPDRLIPPIQAISSTTKARRSGIEKATTKAVDTNSGGRTWAMTIGAKTDKQAE